MGRGYSRSTFEQGSGSPRAGVNRNIDELAMRVENLIKIGRVETVDYNAGKARIRVGTSTEEGAVTYLTDWLPWVTLRAGNNRYWMAPEEKEQVVVFSPSGLLDAGFILPAIACVEYPHEASGPEYEKVVYQEPDSEVIAAFREFNRSSGLLREWLKEDGSFRFEIGEKSGIIMDKEHVQLRVEDTQIVLKKDSIKLHVRGQETELKLTPENVVVHVQGASLFTMTKDSIISTVNGSGVLRITSSIIEAAVNGSGLVSIAEGTVMAGFAAGGALLKMTKDTLKAALKGAGFAMSSSGTSITGGSSGLSMGSDGATLTSPQFKGMQGSAPPTPEESASVEPYHAPAQEPPHITVVAPAPATGNKPHRPSAS